MAKKQAPGRVELELCEEEPHRSQEIRVL
jgi:hypothetical protein